jgi:hypothetical protein
MGSVEGEAEESGLDQAGDIGTCEIRAAVHNAFIRFDSRNLRIVSDALASRTDIQAAEKPCPICPIGPFTQA